MTVILDPNHEQFYEGSNLARVFAGTELVFLEHAGEFSALGKGCRYRYTYDDLNPHLHQTVFVFLPEGGSTIDQIELSEASPEAARAAIIAHGGIDACTVPDNVFAPPRTWP